MLIFASAKITKKFKVSVEKTEAEVTEQIANEAEAAKKLNIKVDGKEIASGAEEIADDLGKAAENNEAHNVVDYMKLKESYKVQEIGSDVIESLKATGELPGNYITKSQAESLGWSSGKALNNYAPGKAIGGDIYYNTTGVVPNSAGRVWYEADVGIDYTMSRSNAHNPAYRILYSNDGLIYGTFDHYETVFRIHP